MAEIVGIMPAGGHASRVAPLPCSKELFPIGFRAVDGGHSFRPKVVCHYLLESMRLASITKAYVILRHGKWDIPAYLSNGRMVDMRLAYLMMDLPYGVPYTIDQAFPFVKESVVALGFPDIVFEPKDAFVRLLTRLEATDAEVVLGLFPAPTPQTMDMVECDEDGRVRQIHCKPRETQLAYTWIIAVWGRVFTRFMHEHLQERTRTGRFGVQGEDARELYMGDVIQTAIREGVHVNSLLFDEGRCLDIGIPEDMEKALRLSLGGWIGLG